MTTNIAQLTLLLLFVAIGSVARADGMSVGPGMADKPAQPVAAPLELSQVIPLEIAIPVLDPGLPEKEYEATEKGVWPELRRAEAHRLAWSMKLAVDESRRFSATRVTPNASSSADLYVLGKILKSNGEDLHLEISVFDSTGKRWYKRKYKHRNKGYWYANPRNKGKDPFVPLYRDVVADLEKYAAKKKDKDILKIQQVTSLRFAHLFAPESFGRYFKVKKGKVKLLGMPAADDPMVMRTNAVRVRDQVFVDSFQAHYASFVQSMDEPYLMWQQESGKQATALRKAKSAAMLQTSLGILAALGGAVAISNSGRSNGTSNGGQAAAGAAVMTIGAVVMNQGFFGAKDAKMLEATLEELSNGINAELYPRVVQMQDRTVTLSGTAEEQFAQWRGLLDEIYRAENSQSGEISVVVDCATSKEC